MLKNIHQGESSPGPSSGLNDDSRSANWRPPKTPGAQIGRYQNKEQVCTKQAADLFSDAVVAPVHQRQQQIPSQPMRSWSSIGRYTSGQQRVANRPRYDSGPEASHQRRMMPVSEAYPSRDNDVFDRRGDEE